MNRLDRDYFDNSVNIVTVVGAGISGVSAARLAAAKGKKVRITDTRDNINDDYRESLQAVSVDIQTGCHSREFLKGSDLVILSPGVDADEFARTYLAGLDIPYTGEIEFAWWFCKSRDIIAVTGTNGKTTVTYLTGQILKEYTGREVHVLGNIGSPFSAAVKDIGEEDIVVLEISSFQLQSISTFCPRVACLLNIGQDHLDRHSDIQTYFAAKKRIFVNQDKDCYAVFSEGLSGELANIKAQRISVSADNNFDFVKKIAGIYVADESSVDEYLKRFKGLPHRLESIAVKDGVHFINDSKSTNVLSTIYALKSIKTPVILIAGGRDKGLDYSKVNSYLNNVKTVILIGEAKDKIKESIVNGVEVIQSVSLRDAVSTAFGKANPEDTVLLSPMCSSFDSFKNYKERGDVFRQAVHKL